MVTIELYGLPRLRAGAELALVPPGRLHEVLRALVVALPGLSPDIVRDGRTTPLALVALDGGLMIDDPELEISDGAVLVLVSAQAGG